LLPGELFGSNGLLPVSGGTGNAKRAGGHNIVELPLQNLIPGVYYVSLRDVSGFEFKKLAVER
jgi:hypothetical protein